MVTTSMIIMFKIYEDRSVLLCRNPFYLTSQLNGTLGMESKTPQLWRSAELVSRQMHSNLLKVHLKTWIKMLTRSKLDRILIIASRYQRISNLFRLTHQRLILSLLSFWIRSFQRVMKKQLRLSKPTSICS